MDALNTNNWESFACCAKSLQWFLTLCDSMEYSLPGSPVHGILQARLLEWVASESSQPRDPTRTS